MIQAKDSGLSIRQPCDLLDVNRSSYYYKPTQRDETDIANEIHDLWLQMPFYGYRRVTQGLKNRGYTINHKRVLRLMKAMGIEAMYPKPRRSSSQRPHQKYPYLLKDLEINRPNQVWATDITYLKLPMGFAYIVALIDVYSRYIISWRMSNTMDVYFCLEMLEEGLFLEGPPEILNTDQGSQFTSEKWIQVYREFRIPCQYGW